MSTCAEKALVEATPFSMPARSSRVRSASRTMELLSTLQSASVESPCALASLIASRVSAVSPDWEITTNRPFGSNTGSR